MKSAALLLLSAGLAIPSHLVVHSLRQPPARASSPNESSGLAELRSEVQDLRESLQDNVGRLLALNLSAGTAQPDSNTVTAADIEAALKRWLERNELPPGLAAPPDRQSPTADGRASEEHEAAKTAAALPIDQLLALMGDSSLSEMEVQRIFEELRKNGRIDEYIATVEAAVERDPSNADLRTALGVAYLQKLFGLSPGPESGVLAMKADEAFDAALEIDSTNWGARFVKAVSLSNWPAFLGKQSEAIDNFETLISQQETLDPRPEFSQSYLFLGNMYQQIGEREKALATWRKGLELFPLSEELRDQVDLTEGER